MQVVIIPDVISLMRFEKVINEKEDPRETVLDYAITIDEELIKKADRVRTAG